MYKHGFCTNTPTSPSPPAALAAEEVLRGVFQSWAYIETRFSVLQSTNSVRTRDPGQTYNIANETGGLLSLRTDFTSLVAQEAATAGRAMARPLRRSYCGTAFRKTARDSDFRREVRQSGVEMIGASGAMADAEIVTLASEGLAALQLMEAQIHLGHVGFIDALLRSSNLSEQGKTTVCNLLARHDRFALADVLATRNVPTQAANALIELLDLVGSPDVLAEACKLTTDSEALRVLDEMEEISRLIEQSHLPVPVIIDLTEVRDRSYYTGIRFEGFVPLSGFPIMRGGRYDNLTQQYGKREPAIGCAFEMDRLAPLLVSECNSSDIESVLLRYPASQWSDMLTQARTLRAQGQHVTLDVLSLPANELESYCAAYGISRVFEAESNATVRGGRPCDR